MKITTIAGLLLIAFGLFALVSGGITTKEREKVLDIGPIEATATEKKTYPIPTPLGVLAVVGGVVLLVAGRRRAV
jgi:uncharacterized membrane protein